MHPGAPIVAAVVASGEETGADGASVLAAVVLGYDVGVRLSQALTPKATAARGFHATAVCGTFGAVAALGNLHRDDAELIESALGLAGSIAMGSLQFLEGGDANKRLQVGYAAHNAVVARRLAAAGVRGSPAALEGKFGAFVTYSGQPDPAALTLLAGDRRAIEETAIKPYPCNRFAHAALDALLDVLRESDLAAGEIERAQIRVPTATAALIAGPQARVRRPRSVVEGQFSLYFVAAAAMLRRRFTPAEFDLLDTVELRRQIDRIEVCADAELDRGPARMPGAVVVHGRGRAWARRVDVPSGEPERPLEWPALIAKFDALASPCYDAQRRAAIVERVRRLDELSDVRELTALLGAATAGVAPQPASRDTA